jgi:quinol monooxygenase YgiN
MQVVHVHVQVKPESIEAFRQATVENARNSVREPGIARFDVIQNTSNPAHFVLVEVYRNSDAPAQHKATAHYLKWRDAVAEMMAEPRTSTQFRSAFPDDEGW